MKLQPPNPLHWRLSTLLKLGPEDVHEIACRAVGTVTAFRLLLGRCLLAMDQSKGYKALGYSTTIHYACAKLGLECREARESRRVAERLLGLSELTLAAETGRISWCKLREIVRKASPVTEAFWLVLAQTKTASEIAALVARTPEGSIPGEEDDDEEAYASELRCAIKPEVFMMLEHARRAYALESGEAVTSAAVVEMALASYIEGRPVSPETLERVRAETSQDVLAARARRNPLVCEARDLAAEMGLLQPDRKDETPVRFELDNPGAEVEPVAEGTTDSPVGEAADHPRPTWVALQHQAPITQEAWRNLRLRFNPANRFATKAQRKDMLRRDGWCCRAPGCPNRIWLHLHHLHEYSQGGATVPDNQACLCSGCHQNVHDGLMAIHRTDGGELVFTDANGQRLGKQADLELAGWLDFYAGWSGRELDSHQIRAHNGEWSVYAVAG